MSRRWLVDAMNVIGSRPDKWWNHPQRAMQSFAESLDLFADMTGDDVTVVFDKDPKLVWEPANARVVVASRRGRNAADHEIASIVERDENPSSLLVVTSDKQLIEKVRKSGARVVPSRSFRDQMEATLRRT